MRLSTKLIRIEDLDSGGFYLGYSAANWEESDVDNIRCFVVVRNGAWSIMGDRGDGILRDYGPSLSEEAMRALKMLPETPAEDWKLQDAVLRPKRCNESRNDTARSRCPRAAKWAVWPFANDPDEKRHRYSLCCHRHLPYVTPPNGGVIVPLQIWGVM